MSALSTLFSGNQGQQTTTTAPWKDMQPYLRQVGSEAQDLYNSGSGFNPFPGSTFVPMSQRTVGALGNIWGTAQGDTSGQTGWDALSPIAQGQAGLGMEGDYRGMAGQGNISTGALGALGGGYAALGAASGNDAWNRATDINAGKIANDVNRMWDSSGRYGSAGQTNDLVSQIGDYRTQATAQGFNDAYNRQMGALGGQVGVANNIAGIQQGNFGNQMGILGAITGQRQQDIGNQLSAINQIPQIQQSMYVPGQMQTGVGSAYDDAAARKKQAAIDQWDAKDKADWSRLGAYAGMVGGPAGQGQTMNTTVTPPSNPFGAAIGGALAGAQAGAGSPWMVPGALAGGALGFLSGMR